MTKHHCIGETIGTHQEQRKMLMFVVFITWSAVAANPIFQVVTPSSAEQEVTYPDNLNVDEYLRRYGYMNNVNEHSDDYEKHRADAIKSFQEFAGLEVTGVTDETTREVMLKPRCGMKDIEIHKPVNDRWNISKITYNIISYTKDLSESDTRSAVAAALTVWEGPSKLTFKRVESRDANMEIRFVTKNHPPCVYPMDGPRGILAHAFFPSEFLFGGHMHFDDAENFTYKTSKSKGKGEGKVTKLDALVLHESGHALGLSHDKTKGSVMSPWYNGQTTLGQSDIRRIKALYK